ncbi:PREDICTED: C-C motif chemokine 14 isoform X3 [Colobus angolensis palliatus]|uniref:C-C motif chemokine 14 isoform X3 n=1 Tax=Colobus angolensis palliatus TaxID=336983 RepID=UPI0005F55A04|nr:PREDICTED: C-C motif chemokine 14 isoform X3 [Colobus angolensis palliatus]
MKVSLVAISFFLLTTIALGTKTESSSRDIRCSLLGGTLPPSECCLTYTTHKIPHQRIMDYYETNSQCAKPGIVFITKRGHSICTNPRDKWVQDYIKHMEEN